MLSNKTIEKCENYLYNLSGEDFEKFLEENYKGFWYPMEKFNEVFRKIPNIAEAIQNMSPNFDFSHKFFRLNIPTSNQIISADTIYFLKEEREGYFNTLLYQYKESYWYLLPEYLKLFCSSKEESKDINISIFIKRYDTIVNKYIRVNKIVYTVPKAIIITTIDSSLDKEIQNFIHCTHKKINGIEENSKENEKAWQVIDKYINAPYYYLNNFESEYSLFQNKLKKYNGWNGYYQFGYGTSYKLTIQKYVRKNFDGTEDIIFYYASEN